MITYFLFSAVLMLGLDYLCTVLMFSYLLDFLYYVMFLNEQRDQQNKRAHRFLDIQFCKRDFYSY